MFSQMKMSPSSRSFSVTRVLTCHFMFKATRRLLTNYLTLGRLPLTGITPRHNVRFQVQPEIQISLQKQYKRN
jgi:hypothetical protein